MSRLMFFNMFSSLQIPLSLNTKISSPKTGCGYCMLVLKRNDCRMGFPSSLRLEESCSVKAKGISI